jgi:flagellar biogenesis protein FliO
MAPTPEQRRANARLALILASMALIFAIGFVVRIAYFGG